MLTIMMEYSIEQIANHLANLNQLHKDGLLTDDELFGARFGIKTLIGSGKFIKAMEMAKQQIK